MFYACVFVQVWLIVFVAMVALLSPIEPRDPWETLVENLHALPAMCVRMMYLIVLLVPTLADCVLQLVQYVAWVVYEDIATFPSLYVALSVAAMISCAERYNDFIREYSQ